MDHSEVTAVGRAMRTAFRDIDLRWFAREEDVFHAWLSRFLEVIDATDFRATNPDSRADPHVIVRWYVPLDVVMPARNSPASQPPTGPPTSPETAVTSELAAICTAEGLQGFAPTAGSAAVTLGNLPNTLAARLRAVTCPASDKGSAVLSQDKLEEQNRQYGANVAKLRSELNEALVAAPGCPERN